jgi:primosomal protein N' (replication factor Y)
VLALVESSSDASAAKSDIKNASFVTRKLEVTTPYKIVHPECIKAAEQTAYYFAEPLGTVMKALIPEAILSEATIPDVAPADSVTDTDTSSDNDTPDEDEFIPEVLTFQSHNQDRYSTYKGIVREEFARKKSVLLIVPTTVHVEMFKELLKKGIDDYVVGLHSGLSKKAQKENWDKALREDHPMVIIATPMFMSVPRTDISTIILDRESSRSYINSFPPYIDFRTHIEYYAQHMHARLILADTLLRVETLYRRERGEIHDLFPPSFRLENLPGTIIVDMTEKSHREKDGFRVLSEELISMIEYSQKKKENMFIFCARRGLSPQAVCGDCGSTVLCTHCSAPVVLHNSKNEGGRYFLCHHCGHKRSAMECCKKCTSWKLITLGIGIDTVYEEIEKKFPDVKLFKIDKDSVKTEKQAKDIIKQYERTPGSILIGTETALTFLPPVPHIAIASMDSLFSLPDFRVNERIAHILLRLIYRASTYFLIQTRNAHVPLLKQITTGTFVDFYRDEIAVRKAINYPPFSVQIKITVEDTREKAADEMERLHHILEQWKPMVFPAFIPTQRGKAVLHMLISVPPEQWPEARLRDTLVALPHEFMVKVNPESLL